MTTRCLCPDHADITPMALAGGQQPPEPSPSLRAALSETRLQRRPHVVAAWEALFHDLASTPDDRWPERFTAHRAQAPDVWDDPAWRSRFFQLYPSWFPALWGTLPQAASLIAAAELFKSPIKPATMEDCQRWCMETANAMQRAFYQVQLRPFLPDPATLNYAAVEELLERVIDQIPPLVQQVQNQRVSTAGGVHQRLVVRTLESLGWRPQQEFEDLGSQTLGDIAVYGPGRTQCIVEVKSLNARERLRNSLAKVAQRHDAVVGIGFFHQAHEFNESATRELVSTGALAVYMPAGTIAELHPSQQNARNRYQTAFYRPLAQFAGDMQQFRQTGRVP